MREGVAQMVTKTTNLTAALRSRGVSSFVLSTGANAFWQLGATTTGHESLAAVARPRVFSVVGAVPQVDRDYDQTIRMAAKPARPPRGVPR